MAATPLTKSYIDTHDPDYPIQEDLVLYELFEKARRNGVVGELVNLESNERTTTTEILDKADGYAKGLLALGLVPGEDTLTIIGIASMESAVLFTACAAVGLGFAQPYIYTPKDVSIMAIIPQLEPRVVVVGEGAGGTTCTEFLRFFDESKTTASSDKLPFIEHVFYDISYDDRKPAHKFLKLLSQLVEIGKSVTDEQLAEAKKAVKPEYTLHHLFSSGSTGQPKCIAHSHYGLANELLLLRAESIEPVITMNPNLDEMISYGMIALTLAGKITKTVIILDLTDKVTPEEAAMIFTQAIIDEGVQYLALPGSVESMIKGCITENNIDFPPVKLFLNGSQIISRGFKQNLKDIFQGIAFTVYGMTETFPIAYTPLGDSQVDEENRMLSKLYPKPNIKFRIVGENGEIADIGQDGSVEVKTYSRLKEYLKQDQLTKDLFTEDGYVKTGDMAVMYPDGTFVIKGRTADAMRFKVLGDVIYPGPIEEAMSKHPAIEDISVIAGSVNDFYGDEITYCISLNSQAEKPTEEQLITHGLSNGMDESYRPCRIIYFDKLPTTANSRKVSKAILRKTVFKMVEEEPKTGLCEWYIEFVDDVAGEILA